jgi:hypothetical protein
MIVSWLLIAALAGWADGLFSCVQRASYNRLASFTVS